MIMKIDKYINVKDLETFFKVNTVYYKNFIINAKPMIAVSDVETAIKLLEDSAEPFDNACSILKCLITPKAKRYGGLTTDDWEKLEALFNVTVRLLSDMGTREICTLEELFLRGIVLSEITKLLPDPENHIRYHDGTDINPLPDNVEIELHGLNRKVVKRISQDVYWHCEFGYRILGVADE